MEPLPWWTQRPPGGASVDAGFGSWLLGMSLGGSALGGMLGMASGIFIVLAATTFGSALLYAISGFGFAVLAAPLFLLFLDPARAIQLVIIISTCCRSLCFGGCCRLSRHGCCFAWHSVGCRSASSPSVMLIQSWCGRLSGR